MVGKKCEIKIWGGGLTVSSYLVEKKIYVWEVKIGKDIDREREREKRNLVSPCQSVCVDLHLWTVKCQSAGPTD